MGRRERALTFGAALAVAGAIGCGGAPRVDWTLTVGGAVERPLSLDYAALAAMPQVEAPDVVMEKTREDDEVMSFTGVPLAHLLAEAGPADGYTAVTLISADGYSTDATVDELADALVALKQDGAWLPRAHPDQGPIRLVCPHAPANRWVYQLAELRVIGPTAAEASPAAAPPPPPP